MNSTPTSSSAPSNAPSVVQETVAARSARDPLSLRLKPLEGKRPGELVVHEIYRSLQGESRFAGLPCVFVRLTACHLRCVYCDTPHSFHQGRPLSVDSIVDEVERLGDPLVELTGGEPLLQPEALELLRRLADLGRTVLLETSGAVSTRDVDPRVHVILDVKTPASGECAANLDENLTWLRTGDEIKYVICDRADFDWSLAHLDRHRLIGRCEIVFSPAHGRVDPTRLAEWVLDSRRPIRLQLQLHKQLWAPEARGV